MPGDHVPDRGAVAKLAKNLLAAGKRALARLEQGNDPEKIEAEYIDAKRRERDAIRAGQQWDKLAGIAELRFSASDQLKRLTDLIGSLASTKPTTAQGAAAAARFLNRDLRDEVPQSHRRILRNLSTALEQWELRA